MMPGGPAHVMWSHGCRGKKRRESSFFQYRSHPEESHRNTGKRTACKLGAIRAAFCLAIAAAVAAVILPVSWASCSHRGGKERSNKLLSTMAQCCRRWPSRQPGSGVANIRVPAARNLAQMLPSSGNNFHPSRESGRGPHKGPGPQHAIPPSPHVSPALLEYRQLRCIDIKR